MWLILLACFLVVEAITVGLTTIWFAGGALVAAIASGLGAGILTQWVLFLVISLVLLIFTRPLAVRYMNKGVPKTNVNSLIGERAVVIRKSTIWNSPDRFGSMTSSGWQGHLPMK